LLTFRDLLVLASPFRIGYGIGTIYTNGAFPGFCGNADKSKKDEV